jgi:hypothetical protein
MPNPYATEAISGFNASPPPDDGTEVAANEVEWQKHIDKIGAPLKQAVENIDTKLVSAFAKRAFNDVVEVSADTNLSSSHDGQLIVANMATGNVTLPDAANAAISDNFFVAVLNENAASLTLDSAGGTVNGALAATGIELAEDEWGIAVSNGTNWFVLIDSQPEAASFGFGHIAGMHMKLDGGDTDHDVQIGLGSCRDFADGVNMELTSVITKKIDVDWAEGDDQGGFPSALTLTANTTYFVFVIHKTADGTIDAGFDTSATAANLLSDATGYSGYRRVGSIRTNGDTPPNIRGFRAVGDHIYFDYDDRNSIEPEHTVTNFGANGTKVTLDQIPGIATGIWLDVSVSGTGNANVTGIVEGDDTVTTLPAANSPMGQAMGQNNTGSFISHNFRSLVPATSAGEVLIYGSQSTIDAEISVAGWFDDRSLG